MNTQTEKMLTTSWNLVRDAGSAVSDAAVTSRVGTSLARNLPKVKNLVSIGAGLALARQGTALARQGTKVAVSAVRRHPVAAIAGAVALAGLGFAIAVASRRKKARENGDATGTTRRLEAKNMRANGSAKKASAKAAPRAPRTRKARENSTAH